MIDCTVRVNVSVSARCELLRSRLGGRADVALVSIKRVLVFAGEVEAEVERVSSGVPLVCPLGRTLPSPPLCRSLFSVV